MTLSLMILLAVMFRTSLARTMDKLADSKLCADAECSYALSLATAVDDFTAPDCRFINIRAGQMVYVYSKLVAEEGAGVFWSGSIYGERYVEQLGVIGYFPATLVKEMVTFKEDTVQVPTTDMDFYCD